MSYRKHLMTSDEPPSELFKATEVSTNLAEVGTDCISRQAAIDALENDKAALDQIIKGMSAMDVRLDAYVSQRNQVVYDIDTIEQLPPIQPEPAQWVQMLINPRMYRCSNCNIAWNKRLVFDLDHGNEMVMKYCPCCGKKMLAEVDYE